MGTPRNGVRLDIIRTAFLSISKSLSSVRPPGFIIVELSKLALRSQQDRHADKLRWRA